MYGAIVVLILILHAKFLSCLLGEDGLDATTEKPMVIASLDYNDLCKFQPNGYDCGKVGKRYHRYYYDIKLEDCKATSVGDCEDNQNIFSDMIQCKDNCRDLGQHPVTTNLTANVYCRFQPDFGMCNEYHPLWYYDVATKTCRGFSYSGCGGNQNKFKTAHDCTSTCVPAVTYVKQDWM